MVGECRNGIGLTWSSASALVLSAGIENSRGKIKTLVPLGARTVALRDPLSPVTKK
jgi:hypothetical protein